MRILITGGAGFQGSHLAEQWVTAGHEVTILNTYSTEAETNLSSLKSDVLVVWGSITDREIVDKTIRGHEVVVHLAARISVDESLTGPQEFLDVNIGGTMNVLEATRKTGARVIFASSCEVYGYIEHSPVSESSELRPHSPYAASKAGADRMCFAYHKSFGLDITILRPCNIYGVRQKLGPGGAVIPIFANRAANNQSLTIFGTGNQRREYMHVNDLVKAYDLILNRPDLNGVTLNIGTGDTPSVKEIASLISSRGQVTINHAPERPGEVLGFELDSSAIRSLGFEPQVDFWNGLEDYLNQWPELYSNLKP